jgi:hypothetical protein
MTWAVIREIHDLALSQPDKLNPDRALAEYVEETGVILSTRRFSRIDVG